MKCSKCGKLKFEMVWVKRFVEVMSFAIELVLEGDLDGMLGYGRREMQSRIDTDVKNGLNAGETLYCKDCYKELDK